MWLVWLKNRDGRNFVVGSDAVRREDAVLHAKRHVRKEMMLYTWKRTDELTVMHTKAFECGEGGIEVPRQAGPTMPQRVVQKTS
jgi:hypothetical protein